MKPYKQIYEEILERKLRAYASELEHRVSSIKITPSESTVLAGATALPFSGMAEPKLNVAGKGIKSKVMGGVLAGALALTGSHIAGLQRSVNNLGADLSSIAIKTTKQPTSNVTAVAKKPIIPTLQLSRDLQEASSILKRLQESQHISAAIQQKSQENLIKVYGEDFTKPVGASVVLINKKDDVVGQWGRGNSQFHGFNVIVGHGNAEHIVTHDSTIKSERNWSNAKHLFEILKHDPNYKKDLPIRLISCNVGNGHVPQELADISGVPVTAFTNKAWMTNNHFLGVFPTDKTLDPITNKTRPDYSNPGSVVTFYPTVKKEVAQPVVK